MINTNQNISARQCCIHKAFKRSVCVVNSLLSPYSHTQPASTVNIMQRGSFLCPTVFFIIGAMGDSRIKIHCIFCALPVWSFVWIALNVNLHGLLCKSNILVKVMIFWSLLISLLVFMVIKQHTNCNDTVIFVYRLPFTNSGRQHFL